MLIDVDRLHSRHSYQYCSKGTRTRKWPSRNFSDKESRIACRLSLDSAKKARLMACGEILELKVYTLQWVSTPFGSTLPASNSPFNRSYPDVQVSLKTHRSTYDFTVSFFRLLSHPDRRNQSKRRRNTSEDIPILSYA